MNLPFFSTDCAAGRPTPALTEAFEATALHRSPSTDNQILALNLQELSTIAAGWGSIDPI